MPTSASALRTSRRCRHHPLEQLPQLIWHQPLNDPHSGRLSNTPIEMTCKYQDATSTIPVGVSMSATVERAGGTSQPLFSDQYIPNTKGDTGQLNLGN